MGRHPTSSVNATLSAGARRSCGRDGCRGESPRRRGHSRRNRSTVRRRTGTARAGGTAADRGGARRSRCRCRGGPRSGTPPSAGASSRELSSPSGRAGPAARPREKLAGQGEMALRKRASLGQAVALSDLDGLDQSGRASRQMRGGAFGVELRQPTSRESEVVERDAAGNLALAGPPLERLLEERLGLLERGRVVAQIRKGRGEVVQGTGMPTGLAVRGEMLDGRGEEGARP